MKMSIAVAAVAVALAGCAAGPKAVDLGIRFDPDATAPLLKPGNNTVEGSALVRFVNGDILTCAGNFVSLVPVTPYSRAWAKELTGKESGGFRAFSEGEQKFNDQDAFYKAQIDSTCAVDGKFSFDNVADGEFYVFTMAKQQIATGVGAYLRGGLLTKLVKAEGGKTVRVVLAP